MADVEEAEADSRGERAPCPANKQAQMVGKGASGTPEPEVGQLQEKLAQLEEETAALRLRCVVQTQELEDEKQHCIEEQEELEEEKEACKELVVQVEQAKEAAYRLWNEAELERLRAVAKETKKWRSMRPAG